MSSEYVIKSLQFLHIPQRMFNIISCERNAKLVASALDLLVEMLRDKPLVCAGLSSTGAEFIRSAIFVLEKVSEPEYFMSEIDEEVKHLACSALQFCSVAISAFDPGEELAGRISLLFEDFFSDDRYRIMTIRAIYTVSYYQPAIAATYFANSIPCIMHAVTSAPLPLCVFENCIGVMNNFADFSVQLATSICLLPEFTAIPIIPESKNFTVLMTTLLRVATETSNSDMLLQLRIVIEHFSPVILDGFSGNEYSERVSCLRLTHQMLATSDMSIIRCLFPDDRPDFVHTLLDMAESLDREVLELCAESILILLRTQVSVNVEEILLSYDISEIVSNSDHGTNKTALAFQRITEILNSY